MVWCLIKGQPLQWLQPLQCNGFTESLISGMEDTRSIQSKLWKVKAARSEANSQSPSCIDYTFQREKLRPFFASGAAPV